MKLAWRSVLYYARLRLELQLGNRLVLFAVADLVLLAAGLVEALISTGEPRDLYFRLVLLPSLLLGLPALADLVALERHAGSLDLALATPDPRAYLVRRAATVGALLAAQAGAIVLVLWLEEGCGFPLLPPLLHALACNLLLTAAAGFWAVRIETAGGVWFSTLATIVAFGRWFFANPVAARGDDVPRALLPAARECVEWAGRLTVLALAATLFYAYARRRLAHPEKILT